MKGPSWIGWVFRDTDGLLKVSLSRSGKSKQFEDSEDGAKQLVEWLDAQAKTKVFLVKTPMGYRAYIRREA